MEKSIKIIIIGFLLFVMAFGAHAQTEFFIGGQLSKPYSLTRNIDFSDHNGKGLYARNGGGFTIEINTRKMFGFGGLFSYSGFGVDFEELAKDLRAISIQKSGIVGSTQFGFGPVANLPLLADAVYLQLKSYVGFRALNIPDFVANYSPKQSRYVTVEYTTYGKLSTFYQFGGALQMLPKPNFGISLGVEYLGGTVSTFNYTFLTDGSKIIEGQDKINQSIHFYSYKLGLVFILK